MVMVGVMRQGRGLHLKMGGQASLMLKLRREMRYQEFESPIQYREYKLVKRMGCALTRFLQERNKFVYYRHRYVRSGSVLEHYRYARKQSYKISNEERRKAAGEKTASTPEELLEMKKKNLAKAARKLKRLINCNVGLGPHRDCFLTLTFAENKTDVASANEQFHLFVQRMRNWLMTHKGERLKYACSIEFQKRGAVHYHLVLFSFPFVPWDELARLWGHGFVRVNKLSDDTVDIGAYMTKYMTKNADLQALNGKKTYWTSRGLRKPVIILANEGDEIFQRLEAQEKDLLFRVEFENKYLGKVSYTKYLLHDKINSNVAEIVRKRL